MSNPPSRSAPPSRSTPLCFVAMPFGKKTSEGRSIDFDSIWRDIIVPGIEAAGMQPLRADQEHAGGIIHKPMFERLVLCDFALCDLTFANANVFYELGIRHAARPHTTLLVQAEGMRLPFDLAFSRTQHYQLTEQGLPAQPEADAKAITDLLVACRAARQEQGPMTDSPLYQLLDGVAPLRVPSDKTDVFRAHVAYSATLRDDLAAARGRRTEAAVAEVEGAMGPLDAQEAGVVVDLMLSYRAVKAFDAMIALAGRMPEPLRKTVLVQEQLGFALNRVGRSVEAETVLTKLITTRGPSSETLGLLGRVYKDRWQAALDAGDAFAARGHLRKAVEAYQKGFEHDWRDHYPGINAVTLMELQEPPNPDRLTLIPVVRYSVERRTASGESDYWDWATLLELDVLARNKEGAFAALDQALAHVREAFEPETTRRNLGFIQARRTARGAPLEWAEDVADALSQAEARLSPPT